MNNAPRVDVPPEVWEELAKDDLTPLPILGDMSPWVSQYTFPYWQTEHEERVLTLARRGRVGEDRWALLDSPHCYNKRTGRWEYEMRNSERSDRFLEECRLTLAEARPIIVKVVFRLHQHALRKVARVYTLSKQREAAQRAVKAQRQLMANVLSAHLRGRYDALPEGYVKWDQEEL